MKRCNQCGTILPDDAVFCKKCGADLKDPANYTTVEETSSAENQETDEKKEHLVRKCNHCGKIVPDDVKFCTYCGSDLSDPSSYTMVSKTEPEKEDVPEPKPVKKKNKKNRKWFIITGIAVAAVIVAVVLYFVMPKTIDLSKYTTIEVSGYDGHAIATVKIDEEKLSDAIRQAAIQKKTTSDYSEFTPTYTVKHEDNLSNGDTVTLKWNVEPEDLDYMKIRLKTDDITKEVSGLKKIKTFDAFKGVQVQTSGISPDGTAEVNSGNQKGLTYKLDKKSNLKNGDKITVTVSSAEKNDKDYTAYGKQYGEIPDKTTKTFEVSGLDEYVTSVSELSADAIKSMTQKAMQEVLDEDGGDDNDHYYYDDDYDYTYTCEMDNVTYQGLYFLKRKGKKGDYYNSAVIVLKEDYTAREVDDDGDVTDSANLEAYRAVEFHDLTKGSDGKTHVDLSDCLTDNSDFEYEEDDFDFDLNGYETQDDLYEDYVDYYSDEYTSETKAAS